MTAFAACARYSANEASGKLPLIRVVPRKFYVPKTRTLFLVFGTLLILRRHYFIFGNIHYNRKERQNAKGTSKDIRSLRF